MMANKISEERTVYLPSRGKTVRCRLWYEITSVREGLLRYFLVGIEELE
jgi:hypothetical protein